MLVISDWASSPKVGNAYAADVEGRWCSILETKRGAYRGNHIHNVDQYTVLLSGKAIVVNQIDGELVEYSLHKDKIHITRAGIPHILIPIEDLIAYEWWDGPFEAEPCPGVFNEYTKNRFGPRD